MSADTLTNENSVSFDAENDFLTFIISEQRFGVPILQVQDVLGPQNVTHIPLAPPEVSGSLNLRGRIVTAIDLKKRLDLNDECSTSAAKKMSVVVEHEHELYSLIIDDVSDVMSLHHDSFEPAPPTLDPVWRDISDGIFRLDKELLVILNVPKLLGSVQD